MWRKLIKELKSAAKKKFLILKKKSPKLKKFGLFLSFPLYYTLIANEKIFWREYKTFFYDNHQVFSYSDSINKLNNIFYTKNALFIFFKNYFIIY